MCGLWDAVGAAGEDPEVDAVVITGADPAFCAGVDLKEVCGRDPAHRRAAWPRRGTRAVPNGLYRFIPVIPSR